ncbi:MAG: hypothetical protein Q9183_004356 [Haloplaca sp. 2 TL-2023]
MPGSLNLVIESGTPTEIAEDWAFEVDEWLSLVALQSPRIEQGDNIDPYLCRYPKPDADGATMARLVCLRWSGFIPAQWLRHLFVTIMNQTSKHPSGGLMSFALMCQAFKTEIVDCKDGYTILVPSNIGDAEGEEAGASNVEDTQTHPSPGRTFVLWEHAHT